MCEPIPLTCLSHQSSKHSVNSVVQILMKMLYPSLINFSGETVFLISIDVHFTSKKTLEIKKETQTNTNQDFFLQKKSLLDK